jgi:hypothetical protein
MKINGAMQAGCRSVVIPKENTKNLLKEIIYENSIDVKNEYQKRLAFIYYSEFDKSYMMLVRSCPYNKSDDNNKLSAFDVNVPFGKPEYLLSADNKYVNEDVPSLFKLKLSVNDILIDPKKGFNINICDKISLSDVMTSHFVVLGLENIYEIYYYMVMAKYVFDGTYNNTTKTIDVATTEHVELDGITKKKNDKNEKQINVSTTENINQDKLECL